MGRGIGRKGILEKSAILEIDDTRTGGYNTGDTVNAERAELIDGVQGVRIQMADFQMKRDELTSKTEKPFVKMCLLLLFVLLAVIFLLPFIYKHFALVSDPGDTYPTTKTLSMFKDLGITMAIMDLEGYKHPIDMEMIKEYARKTNDRVMEGYIHNNEICDAWNNPILLFYEEPLTYTFISYGPNRKNDQGKGDDIVDISRWNPGIEIEN